ncbi:MAG: glycosyltransferase family 4 protein [Planctomycetota bacterium]|nr:glycosyltransferase family 4 protein [Planctomycetota bacterium]
MAVAANWRRLTIVIHSLTGGGSEHAAAAMASHWAEAGKDVVLLTLDSVENDQIRFSSKVHRVGLGLMGHSSGVLAAIKANRKRIESLRTALVKSAPDRVISLTDRMNVLTLLAARGTGLPVVVSERNDMRHQPIGRIWGWLRRQKYPLARSIVVQTSGARAAVCSIAGPAPVYVIQNFVPPQLPSSAAAQLNLPADRNWFVSVGRLSIQKGFDRLLDAYAEISHACPDWNLVIVGEGSERIRLEEAVQRHGLVDKVLLPGWIESPWMCFPESSIVVLPSRYEGFPNVLLEGMSRGLAPIAFDCESGPSDIIRPDIDGLLVPEGDIEGLSAAMQSLALNPDLKIRMAASARSVNDRFSPERIYAQWDAVLAEE